MKKITCLLILTSFLLSGCVRIPLEDFNLEHTNVQPFGRSINGQLYSVSMGYNLPAKGLEFNENFRVPILWKESVLESLNESGAFKDASANLINVIIMVNYAELPESGGDMFTGIEATYSVIERTSTKELFMTTIRTEVTIPLSFAFSGMTRAKESTNRAVTQNIGEFIQHLREYTAGKRL